MKTKYFFVFTVLFMLLGFRITYAQQALSERSTESACDEFGSRIKNLFGSGKYLEVIGVASEYEQMLLAKYPAPTFELGLFQSQAHHLSFHSPFDGWIQESPKEMEIPEWLPAMGFDFLIALKGKVEDDRFVLFSIDLGKIMYRISGEEKSSDKLTDQELQLGSQMVAANFGVAKNEEFKTVGDHRVLLLEIATPLLGPSLLLANLGEKSRCYSFLISSAAGNRTENEKKLYELIKTVDFKFKPQDTAKIESARKKVTNKTSIVELLECTKELALAEEYGAAAKELSKLCLAVADKMPKPAIDGNVGRYSAYGITLTNPDPDKWKLSTEVQGCMGMIGIEDRFSVNLSVIMVAVINTILAYGPHANELTGEGESEDEKKSFLAMAGQGGIKNVGGVIESERFRIFKGEFAYEGIASVPIPNTKLKTIVVMKPGYMVMVIMFIQASNFNEQSAEFESIVDKYLQIQM